ncbi:MAG: dephospho-CoA kinase, partial [Anaerovoracaceae bacterium]
MKIIGITGGIGSGKSTVSNYLIGKGYAVIDADKISKELMQKGEEGYKQVLEAFGEEILEEDGKIDRLLLAKKVFRNEESKKKLNEITHPLVIAEINRQVKELEINANLSRQGENKLCFVDIPLLFEIGFENKVDEV